MLSDRLAEHGGGGLGTLMTTMAALEWRRDREGCQPWPPVDRMQRTPGIDHAQPTGTPTLALTALSEVPQGAKNTVVAGQAACRYSWMRPLHRAFGCYWAASSERCRWRLRRRLLAEGAVGAVLVVVLEVVDDEPAELILVPDDGPVEQFAAQAVSMAKLRSPGLAVGSPRSSG